MSIYSPMSHDRRKSKPSKELNHISTSEHILRREKEERAHGGSLRQGNAGIDDGMNDIGLHGRLGRVCIIYFALLRFHRDGGVRMLICPAADDTDVRASTMVKRCICCYVILARECVCE